MYYEVIPIKLFRADGGVLTYASDLLLQPGQIVLIPLGRSTTTGIVVKKVAPVDFPTKQIIKTIYNEPLPAHLLKAIFWLSEYYLTPLPTVASLVLPNGIAKNRRAKHADVKNLQNAVKTPKIPLNPAQKMALFALQNVTESTKLLHGVTGSGKTNIYLQMASDALKRHTSVIVLVPEIALTSQLVQVFSSTFNESIILMHSRQTESERHQIWEKILKSNEPRIIIGPRSALFAPLQNLGLIIIDEAHESAFFQENAPKYSALRLASFMAKTLNISCIEGTATPLVTDYYLANSRKALVSLNEKAKDVTPPKVHVINFADRSNFGQNRYFSDQLLHAIKFNLEHHQQTLIFHNRRGSAPLTICEKCGWQALCPTCFLPLTLHSDSYSLICHTCGYSTNVPRCCPECRNTSILHKGFGTKLLENELKKLFKDAKIARFDTDNDKNHTLNARYDDVKDGNIDILIGTQTVAKGLDLPKLATVGVVQADAGLSLPDYSAEERTFHLLTQVIGRVGRGHIKDTNVFIQTFQPDHPIINHAITADYEHCLDYLLKKRRRQHLPPFSYLAKLAVTYKTEAISIKKIKELHRVLKQSPLQISAPTPAFHEHSSTGYTWQIIVKSTSRKTLLDTLKTIDPAFKVHLTIDPPSLL
ncbi:primosomal protein N' [Candidatus Saccharibacteria bacterium]|nr:primosomal protein N' [Candidatus Saccharibacteria bacterium]